jgi:hypothetical protein
MATYPLNELRHKWATGELTVEQAIGHQLQHLIILTEELSEIKQRLRTLEEPRPAAGKPQR